jgi:hypothetical protein
MSQTLGSMFDKFGFNADHRDDTTESQTRNGGYVPKIGSS